MLACKLRFQLQDAPESQAREAGEVRLNPPILTTSAADLRTSFSSRHVGGAQFVFADGSVRFIAESINNTSTNYATFVANGPASLGTYQRLCGRDDGQVVGEFE